MLYNGVILTPIEPIAWDRCLLSGTHGVLMRFRSWLTWTRWPMILLAAVTARAEDQPAQPGGAPVPVTRQLPDLHLLEGPWKEGPVHRESVLFVRGKDGMPTAKLLYDVERVLSVQAANGTRSFQPDRDFVVSEDHSELRLPNGSPIPFLNETDLFPRKGAPNSIGHRAGHPETSVLFDNGHFFHDRQVEVTYLPRAPRWEAYTPKFAAARLERTLAKLRNKEPVTITLSGDSISEGYNASAFTKTPPFMPPVPTLILTGSRRDVDVADAVAFMEALTRKLEHFGLGDLVEPGAPIGGEPTYRMRRH